MSKRDRRPYKERVADLLEPGEQIEQMLAGRAATFANVVFRFGPVTRQVLLTDRNIYVFELEGSERWMGGTPSRLLSKHQRGAVTARYRLVPATLFVEGQEVRPAGRVMVGRGPLIARAACVPSDAPKE
jgi:hypothetical protein